MAAPESTDWNIDPQRLLATGHELFFTRPDTPDSEVCGLYRQDLDDTYQPRIRPVAVYTERVGPHSLLALWVARRLTDVEDQLIVKRPASPLAWQDKPKLYKSVSVLVSIYKQMRAERAMSVLLPTDAMLRATVDEQFYMTGLMLRPADQPQRAARTWNQPDIQPRDNVAEASRNLFAARIIPFRLSGRSESDV